MILVVRFIEFGINITSSAKQRFDMHCIMSSSPLPVPFMGHLVSNHSMFCLDNSNLFVVLLLQEFNVWFTDILTTERIPD